MRAWAANATNTAKAMGSTRVPRVQFGVPPNCERVNEDGCDIIRRRHYWRESKPERFPKSFSSYIAPQKFPAGRRKRPAGRGCYPYLVALVPCLVTNS